MLQLYKHSSKHIEFGAFSTLVEFGSDVTPARMKVIAISLSARNRCTSRLLVATILVNVLGS